MLQNFKRVVLSLVLLSAAALTLLLSDLHSRDRARNSAAETASQLRVAVFKHASNRLLDEV